MANTRRPRGTGSITPWQKDGQTYFNVYGPRLHGVCERIAKCPDYASGDKCLTLYLSKKLTADILNEVDFKFKQWCEAKTPRRKEKICFSLNCYLDQKIQSPASVTMIENETEPVTESEVTPEPDSKIYHVQIVGEKAANISELRRQIKVLEHEVKTLSHEVKALSDEFDNRMNSRSHEVVERSPLVGNAKLHRYNWEGLPMSAIYVGDLKMVSGLRLQEDRMIREWNKTHW